VVGGGSWTVGLYLARFLRPKHFWKLITGELPKFKDVGGTMKVFGQELAGHATLDTMRDLEIEALGQRLKILEEQVTGFAAIGVKTIASPDRERTVMTSVQQAREILARIQARLPEQDRLRAEYEEARRQRQELQRRLAEQKRELLASL
jgi:hypothetical protein